MMKTRIAVCLLLGVFPFTTASAGGIGTHPIITGVIESELGADTPAVVEQMFGEDSDAFSDRAHEHNGAAFDALSQLSTSGATVVGLPSYLVGGDYVKFANNARDNAGYMATVTSDVPTNWFLLLDNRINGPAADKSSPNTNDPVLGGTLQWVIDGGWQRVNTGVSPMGQADYTGVDEGGNAVGPGLGLNNFFSVWTLPNATASVTVQNPGVFSINMISLVSANTFPVPEPSSFGLLLLGVIGLLHRQGNTPTMPCR